MGFRWWSSCKTNAGRRRAVNEDAFLERYDLGLWLVADGMGGAAKGEVASRMVVDAVKGCPRPNNLDEFVFSVQERLIQTSRRIHEKAAQSSAYQVMGSTVIVLLACKEKCVCLWAGDSRAYLLRGGELTQISHDHSLAEQMVERGELSREQAAIHPSANRITRAVGVQHELVLDEVGFDLVDGDSVLLCTDGLNKELKDQEIALVLNSYDCEEASQELVDLSLERGGRDNVTVAVIHFEVTTGIGDAATDKTTINPAVHDHNHRAADHLSFPPR